MLERAAFDRIVKSAVACSALAVGCAQPQATTTQPRSDAAPAPAEAAAPGADVANAQDAEAPAHDTRPPNVLLIVADDLGVMDVSPLNPDTFYRTPNVQRLADEGLLFREAYAAAPVCSPTRASLMTGLEPARLDTTDYFGAPQPERMGRHWTRGKPLLPAPYVERLPAATTSLAEAFAAAGYRTVFAGKWHLGPEGSWPEDHGFEVNHGGITRGGPYGGDKYFSPYGNPRLADGPPGEHLPERLARETAAFFTSHADEPVLAVLSFYSVHTPLMARADLLADAQARRAALPDTRWGREGDRELRMSQDHAVYAGMVEALDLAVGQVLQALDDAGLADETLVVFTSDNGGLSTSEGHPTSNQPYRAGKGWLYEGGLRVPLIVRWPGVVAAGARSDEPVISHDLFPTLLDAAELPVPPVDGASLLPLLRDELPALPTRDLHWHYPHYGNQGGAPGSALRAGRFKLVEWFEDGRHELYDLRDDPGETTDLAAEQPERVADLSARLAAWRERVDARLPTPNPDAD